MRSSLAVLAAGASIVSAAEHPSSFSKVKRDHQNSKRFTTLTGQYQQEVLSSKYTVSAPFAESRRGLRGLEGTVLTIAPF